MTDWITCLTCHKITATKTNPATEFGCGGVHCDKCVKKYKIGGEEE